MILLDTTNTEKYIKLYFCDIISMCIHVAGTWTVMGTWTTVSRGQFLLTTLQSASFHSRLALSTEKVSAVHLNIA